MGSPVAEEVSACCEDDGYGEPFADEELKSEELKPESEYSPGPECLGFRLSPEPEFAIPPDEEEVATAERDPMHGAGAPRGGSCYGGA